MEVQWSTPNDCFTNRCPELFRAYSERAVRQKAVSGAVSRGRFWFCPGEQTSGAQWIRSWEHGRHLGKRGGSGGEPERRQMGKRREGAAVRQHVRGPSSRSSRRCRMKPIWAKCGRRLLGETAAAGGEPAPGSDGQMSERKKEMLKLKTANKKTQNDDEAWF